MALRFTELLNKRKRNKFSFFPAPKVFLRVKKMVNDCNLLYIKTSRIFCIESIGSRSRAYARIWGLSRIWQETLKISPAYVLEVTHHFTKLPKNEQDKVLLHELAHVPKNFSGAVVGHNGIAKRVQQMMKSMDKRQIW